MTHKHGDEPASTVPSDRVAITVLRSQRDALRAVMGDELSDDELYSAAAIVVLLHLMR